MESSTAKTNGGSRFWIIRVWRGGAALEERGRVSRSLLAALPCAVWFGLCTCAYLLTVRGDEYRRQVIASAVKVPLLLLVALLVSYLLAMGLSRFATSPVRPLFLWRLAAASVSLVAFLLAPLGAVLALCALTKNYSIVVLACYGCFILAGSAGAVFAITAARRATFLDSPRPRNAWLWALLFALAATECGWVMRPFVGWTGQPFTWVRHDRTQIYEQVYWELYNLIHGGGAKFPEPDPK